MSSADSDDDNASIFSDNFLSNNQFGEEPDPDIGYLLQHTPHNLNNSFYVPWVQSPETPISLHSDSVPTSAYVPITSLPVTSFTPVKSVPISVSVHSNFETQTSPVKSDFTPSKISVQKLPMEKLAVCR